MVVTDSVSFNQLLALVLLSPPLFPYFFSLVFPATPRRGSAERLTAENAAVMSVMPVTYIRERDWQVDFRGLLPLHRFLL
jgi:hypothetical protein